LGGKQKRSRGTGEEKNLYFTGSGENTALFPAHAAPFMAEKKQEAKERHGMEIFFAFFR
jgi:hypothetical protein